MVKVSLSKVSLFSVRELNKLDSNNRVQCLLSFALPIYGHVQVLGKEQSDDNTAIEENLKFLDVFIHL